MQLLSVELWAVICIYVYASEEHSHASAESLSYDIACHGAAVCVNRHASIAIRYLLVACHHLYRRFFPAVSRITQSHGHYFIRFNLRTLVMKVIYGIVAKTNSYQRMFWTCTSVEDLLSQRNHQFTRVTMFTPLMQAWTLEKHVRFQSSVETSRYNVTSRHLNECQVSK